MKNVSCFLLKCSLMVQTKSNQEKVVVTKICFYGSAKIEEKIKVSMMENKGFVAKMIEMKIAEGINILLEHKSIGLSRFLTLLTYHKIVECILITEHCID